MKPIYKDCFLKSIYVKHFDCELFFSEYLFVNSRIEDGCEIRYNQYKPEYKSYVQNCIKTLEKCPICDNDIKMSIWSNLCVCSVYKSNFTV